MKPTKDDVARAIYKCTFREGSHQTWAQMVADAVMALYDKPEEKDTPPKGCTCSACRGEAKDSVCHNLPEDKPCEGTDEEPCDIKRSYVERIEAENWELKKKLGMIYEPPMVRGFLTVPCPKCGMGLPGVLIPCVECDCQNPLKEVIENNTDDYGNGLYEVDYPEKPPKWINEMDSKRKFAVESDRAFVVEFIREKIYDLWTDTMAHHGNFALMNKVKRKWGL